jgi:hypothetical protein
VQVDLFEVLADVRVRRDSVLSHGQQPLFVGRGQAFVGGSTPADAAFGSTDARGRLPSWIAVGGVSVCQDAENGKPGFLGEMRRNAFAPGRPITVTHRHRAERSTDSSRGAGRLRNYPQQEGRIFRQSAMDPIYSSYARRS